MIESTQNNRRDQRREAILRVAREVFFEEGYSAASMSMIAARLGGSKGTLYNYFKNKEELFAAHIEQQCGMFTEATFATLLADDQPVDVVLTRLGESYLSHVFADWAVQNFRLIITEAKRAPELAQIFYRAGPAVGHERLTAYLERARDRGLINARDCRRAAAQFIALCRGEFHFKLMLNLTESLTPDQIRAEVAGAVAMFMTAYGVDATPDRASQ